MSFIDILIAIPLFIAAVYSANAMLSNAVTIFEKYEFYAADSTWQSAERFFAFLDTPLRHCGVGLPDSWESDLFSASMSLSSMPDWSLWEKNISVGTTTGGYNYHSAGDDWGNTLRLVSAVPTDGVVVKALSLESGTRTKAYLSSAVKSDTTLGLTTSVSWILFPGTKVPVRMVSNASSSSPTVLARSDTLVPWGTPVCRLLTMTMYFQNETVYVNFHDDSGAQPLLRSLDDVQFRLDTTNGLLSVRVALKRDEDDEAIEVSRTWKVGF